jgi:hypothetical protein
MAEYVGEKMKNKGINKDSICIIAGMPRAATSFLYHTLPNHPSFFVPSRKETDYFSVNHYRGKDWYLAFYKDMLQTQIGFDISPMYFLDENSPQRIRRFNANVRVVLIIREPVSWIFSFYKHLMAKRYRKVAFKSFLSGYLYKKDSMSLALKFDGGVINQAISRYREAFASNLLLCDFKMLATSPLPMLRAIERFVGVKRFFEEDNFQNVRVNRSADEPATLINILMQQKLVADFVTKAVPKNMIMSIRYRLQSSSAKTRVASPNSEFSDDEIRMAHEIFVEDENYISNLFQNAAVLLGNGASF